ncbi:EAL domain-containing protein [Klebsiella pneumoniae subsp. pneumoniae]|nr:EAL domain-containing protein [Klebsiella pneumoniae subsp. pneumoniae]
MKNAQFTVHYQPVFDVNRGNCGGVEALMRWPLPDGRFITPDIFHHRRRKRRYDRSAFAASV